MICLWLICTSFAVIGSAYWALAAAQLRRFFAKPAAEPASIAASVTLLKPLCGAEPGLEANLKSFCDQDYSGPLQILLAVQDAADPAVAIAERVKAAHPNRDIRIVADSRLHGANRKISNVMNAADYARGDIVVLSDSDMRVSPDYLRRITAALAGQDVGVVTCLYRGLPVAGLWSRLAAAEIDYRFLPSILVGLRLKLATPCFGSTIALKAETLAQIGGFGAFADQLADDYAIGAAVRGLGLKAAIPAFVIDHVCPEASLRELLRRELRWARTIRLIDPIGHLGSIVTHPLPFALAAAAVPGFAGTSLWVLGLTLACGLLVPLQFARSFAGGRVPIWLAPVRDLLSFAVFVASFLPRPVSWRGRRYKIERDGTLTPA